MDKTDKPEQTIEEKYRLIRAYLTEENLDTLRDMLYLETERLTLLKRKDQLNVDGLPQHILNELEDSRDDQKTKIDTLNAAVYHVKDLLYPYIPWAKR